MLTSNRKIQILLHGNEFHDGRNNAIYSDSNVYGDRSVANGDERSILDVIDEDEGSSEEDENKHEKKAGLWPFLSKVGKLADISGSKKHLQPTILAQDGSNGNNA